MPSVAGFFAVNVSGPLYQHKTSLPVFIEYEILYFTTNRCSTNKLETHTHKAGQNHKSSVFPYIRTVELQNELVICTISCAEIKTFIWTRSRDQEIYLFLFLAVTITHQATEHARTTQQKYSKRPDIREHTTVNDQPCESSTRLLHSKDDTHWRQYRYSNTKKNSISLPWRKTMFLVVPKVSLPFLSPLIFYGTASIRLHMSPHTHTHTHSVGSQTYSANMYASLTCVRTHIYLTSKRIDELWILVAYGRNTSSTKKKVCKTQMLICI